LNENVVVARNGVAVSQPQMGPRTDGPGEPLNGVIVRINRQAGSGAILSSDGRNFGFDLTAVCAYDFAVLAVGKPVYFEVGANSIARAFNISSDPVSGTSTDKPSKGESVQLRYLGFEHRGGVRSFRYRRITPGEPPQNFSVNADMILFQRYHVRIQDGPALCRQLLLTGLETAPDPRSNVPCSLTADDMTLFAAARFGSSGAPRVPSRRNSKYA
jgi:hypothetical protein